MKFVLKHFDTPLIRFSAESGAEPSIVVQWTNDCDKALLPLDLQQEITAEKLESWLRHRTIPKNRAYVDSLLSAMGLSPNRPMDIIRLSKGLSLNDCYWVVEEGFDGSFEQCNLFDNRFSRILGQIAFTGHGSAHRPGGISSSPEFTTNGMLPKCWRREKGVIRLYKGGTEGASNTGFEPYSEFYAAQIAQILRIHAIPYHLSKWKGRLCSTCELFTSKHLNYMPIGRIVTRGGMEAVRKFYETLGEEFVKALNDMIVFDALIYNVDRHFGNFGLLIDSKTNRIVSPAPLFDHGNSLFNLVALDIIDNSSAMRKYAKTLLPCVYDDFVVEARKYITHEHRNSLRKLLDFKFKRHPQYNLDSKRLSMLERMVSERAKEILG
ncbi:MAG: hypothetical protein J6T06_12870 [Victivallales bacterium]|nr:hypothetical protein [Victivallales bacterium]